jgi:hypothetical protein
MELDISDLFFSYHGLDLKKSSMFYSEIVSLAKPIAHLIGTTEQHQGIVGQMKFDDANKPYKAHTYKDKYFVEYNLFRSSGLYWNIEFYFYPIEDIQTGKIQTIRKNLDVRDNSYYCDIIYRWNLIACLVAKPPNKEQKNTMIVLVTKSMSQHSISHEEFIGEINSHEDKFSYRMLVHSIAAGNV